ncbi:5-OH-xanthotoxin synthase-like isoform X2 [Gastrolobium bilobum]|uniref:5-OH-xanthotoxin synthase-like isoform X2 n=1 Tax=Gastrolobium bilobum TaxID=150636 RepID=UPI002AB0B20F|nr:5-OH-xanthotoxin synthase-like isoform X2 [Gastrolobium bilobum]
MGVLVLLSLLSILTLFIIHKHRTNRARALLPPGPPGLPLIGNLHQLDNSAPHRSLSQLSKRYGPLMSLRLGSVPTLVVSSAKMATQVLKTHDLIFASRPSFLGPRILSYNFLDLGFTPYSPYWREMKKLSILHLFSSHRVQSFRPIREDEVAQMIQKLSDHRRSRLQVLLNEAQAMMTEFYFSDYFPLMGWVDRVRGILWRLDKTFKELDVFYERVIHDHMDPTRHKTNDQDVTDIIDIFLQMINDHSFSFDLTLDHIKAVLMNIFTAGTDPSSAAIVWAMTALLRNPDVMKKVQGEIRDLFGDKDFVNEDDIERLPYLKAVVKETLRLFPPSPLLLPRETMERCTIDGYEIQAKTLVYVNAWAIARDPENWEDPEKFYPERFLGSSIDLKGKDFEVIPFGAGRRMCPAKHMAVVTVELSLANLLHSFDWEVPRGFDKDDVLDTQVKPGITMHKKNDLYLVAKKHSTISII